MNSRTSKLMILFLKYETLWTTACKIESQPGSTKSQWKSAWKQAIAARKEVIAEIQKTIQNAE